MNKKVIFEIRGPNGHFECSSVNAERGEFLPWQLNGIYGIFPEKNVVLSTSGCSFTDPGSFYQTRTN